MDVEDRLAGLAIAVEDGSIATLINASFAREARRASDHLSHQRILGGREFVERRNMLARKDEHVEGSLGVDILNDHDPLVFVKDRRRNLARNDLAKQALVHCVNGGALMPRAARRAGAS